MLHLFSHSRGQSECLYEGYHSHAARRQGDPAGPGLHQRANDTLLHRPGHACKCAYVRLAVAIQEDSRLNCYPQFPGSSALLEDVERVSDLQEDVLLFSVQPVRSLRCAS